MDGWTTVHYGRRGGQRPPHFTGNRRAGGGFRRMARAPSPPYGRGNFNQNPIQRAPPPRATQYARPNSRAQYRPVQVRREERNTDWQPADPEFGKLIRRLYAVIKTVHHLQNVAPKPGKTEPRGISKMVEVLSRMIKPAAPTRDTADLITGNAKNWGHTTCLILTEHYERHLEEILEGLAELLSPDWKQAFEVAVRWTRRHFSKITQDSIDHAEALVTAALEEEWPLPQKEEKRQKVKGKVREREKEKERKKNGDQTVKVSFKGTGIQVQSQEPLETLTRPRTTRKLRTRTTAARTETQKPRAVHIREITSSPKAQRSWRDRKVRGVMLNRDSSSDESSDESEGGEDWRVIEEPDLLPSRASPREKSLSFHPPQNPIRVRAQVHEISPSPSPDEGDNTVVEDRSSDSYNDSEEDRTDREEGHDTSGSHVVLDMPEDDLEGERQQGREASESQGSFELFSHSEPKRFKVHTNQDTSRKLIDWRLLVTKKWLIIGDSNLCRFPEFYCRDLQIESFPGAHFRHGQGLMEKTIAPSDLVVEKIILGFGINGRENKLKETTMKNVQGIIRSTKRKFPYAEIWVPLVNFSNALPQDEKNNLEALNGYISRNMAYIPLLPAHQFNTETDNVHWTPQTAEAMFAHWMSFLNFQSP